MTNVNVHEAKTHFSRYLNRAQAGESIVVCKNGLPVAMLIPLPPKKKKKKEDFWGLLKGKGEILPGFFDYMSEEDFIEGRVE